MWVTFFFFLPLFLWWLRTIVLRGLTRTGGSLWVYHVHVWIITGIMCVCHVHGWIVKYLVGYQCWLFVSVTNSHVTTVTQIVCVCWRAVLSLGIVIWAPVKSEILHRKWEKVIKGSNSSTGHCRSCHRAAWACFHTAMVAGTSDVQGRGQEWAPPVPQVSALSQGMPGESPASLLELYIEPLSSGHWKHWAIKAV